MALQPFDGELDKPADSGGVKPFSGRLDNEPQQGAIGYGIGQVKAGLMGDLPAMAGRALQYANTPGTNGYALGANMRAYGESKQAENPVDESQGGITKFIAGGARGVAAMAPAIVGGAVAHVLAPEVAVPADIAMAAGMGGLFGGSQGQETLEKARAQGLPEDQAISTARKTAAISGVGMGAVAAISGGLAGPLARAAFGTGAKTAAEVVGQAAAPGFVKPFLQDQAVATASNLASMPAAAAGTAAVEQNAGITGGPTPGEAAAQSVKDALAFSLVHAPIGGVHTALAIHGAKIARNELTNADTDPAIRTQHADQIFKNIEAVDPEAADNFRQNAETAIKNKDPLTLDENVVKPNAGVEPEAAPLQLTHSPDPWISFPDGTVGKRSDAENYIKDLPEDQQVAARAKLLGLGEQDADQAPEPQPLAIENNPSPQVVFPDGTVGTHADADKYIQNLPEDQRIPARAKLLGLGEQQAEPAPSGPLTSGVEAGKAIGAIETKAEGDRNAIQEPGTGEILQREPQGVGEAGGGRGRVEQGQQGAEVAAAREAGTTVGDKSAQEVAPDRRLDAVTRKSVAQMTPDERAKALLTSDLTGLPNKRAYDEHMQEHPDDHVMYGDVDDFKSLNSDYGHNGADGILKAIGDVKADVAKEMGVNAFHRSGDEFLATHADPAKLESYGKAVQDRLAKLTVEVTKPDGSVVEHNGVGFSYGTGKNDRLAESKSDQQKAERKRLGLRTGQRDADSIPESAAGRQQDIKGVPEGSEGRQEVGQASAQPDQRLIPVSKRVTAKEPENAPSTEAVKTKQAEKERPQQPAATPELGKEVTRYTSRQTTAGGGYKSGSGMDAFNAKQFAAVLNRDNPKLNHVPAERDNGRFDVVGHEKPVDQRLVPSSKKAGVKPSKSTEQTNTHSVESLTERMGAAVKNFGALLDTGKVKVITKGEAKSLIGDDSLQSKKKPALPKNPLGETITVDGKERPTTNSDGKPIAYTKPLAENFWRWFGDGKTNEAGKPIVTDGKYVNADGKEKSATENNGNFDGKNPDIRYSRDAEPVAFFDPASGNTYFIADAISKTATDKQLRGLAMHEIASHALHLGRNDADFQKILGSFEVMAKAGNKQAKAAMDRAREADTPAEHLNEEALSYYLEANPDLSLAQRVVSWFRQAIRAIGEKLPAIQRMKWYKSVDKMTGEDLVYAAQKALRDAPATLKDAAKPEVSDKSEAGGKEKPAISAKPTVEELLANNPEEINIKAPVASGEEIESAARIFLSAFSEGGIRYDRTSATARKAKAESLRAADDIGHDPTADRENAGGKFGNFSGFGTTAKIENGLDGKPQLVISLFGKEQVKDDITSSPALRIEVDKTGGFSFYGPPSDGKTYKEFVKRGWAEPAKGADGETQYIAGDKGPFWTRLTGVSRSELIPLLGDIHARVLEWKGEDHTGLHWQRQTGATGGINGKTGAIYFSKSAGDTLAKNLAEHDRDIARGGLRESLATIDRRTGMIDRALTASREYFKSIAPDLRWKSMDQFQKGGVDNVTDKNAKEFFKAWKTASDARADKIQGWDEGVLKELIPNYFSQMWKDPNAALEWYQRLLSKGPLEGGKKFLKQRTYASYKEGMSWKVFDKDGNMRFFDNEKDARAVAGKEDSVKPPLEPISNNPTDIMQMSLQQVDKFIAMHEFRQWLKAKGFVKPAPEGDRVTPGWAKVGDPSFRNVIVPDLIARDLNNHLSKGLEAFPTYRSFRFAQNLLLSARLGFSAFHAGFTTMDTLVSHVDIGARRLLQGDVSGAVKMFAKSLTSPVMAPIEGKKLLEQFYSDPAALKAIDPHTAAILDMLTKGGARGKMDPTDFNNSLHAWRKAKDEGDLKGTALHALPALMEGIMSPIASHLVPWQKMTARVMLMKFEMDRVAADLGKKKGDYAGIADKMNEDAQRQIAYKVVQQVDDRLGQVAYDNMFWNKIGKQIAQASIQSVGWNVGTANVIFGGANDVKRLFKPEQLLAPLDKEGKISGSLGRVTGRLSYLIALNMTVGMMGAGLQYAMTGEDPKDLRDIFFPRTGRKNPDGSDERISLPSYIKDEYALSKAPVQTVQHKLHPSLSMIAELLNNQDFYGNEIVNPDDPWTKVAGQVGEYLGKSFVPYAIQGAMQSQKKGTSTAMQVAPFFGVTPASASVSRTPFESYVQEKASAFHTSKTPEGAEKAQARSDAINAIKKGEKPDLAQFTPQERLNIYTSSRTPIQESQFKRLTLQQKISAYDKATPEEIKKFRLKPIVMRDFAQHGKQMDSDERQRAQEILGSK